VRADGVTLAALAAYGALDKCGRGGRGLSKARYGDESDHGGKVSILAALMGGIARNT
jgi:hypothetical protein